MKRILTYIAIILGVIIVIFCLCKKIEILNEKLSIALNNANSLLIEKRTTDSTYRVLKLTIDQLEYINDSISRVLIRSISDVNVQRKKVSQLQYMLTNNFRVDTIRFIDTLFVNGVNLDTLITDDKWYRLDMKLRDPNVIIVNPKFTNEYTTIFSSKKETINPPRKFFLWRWFQRKHIITETRIINNNPYGSIDTARFVEILKR